jgi:hypothetical protein
MDGSMRTLILLAAAVAGLSVAAADAREPRGEVLVVPSVRLKFEVPRGWHPLDAVAVNESRRRVQLSDPELTRYVQERARLPKMTFTRHPADFPSMNPTLQVYTVDPGHRAAEVIDATLAQLARVGDFKIVEPPHPIALPGRTTSQVRATFTMSVPGAEQPVAVEARLLAITDGTETVVFGFSGPASGDDRCEAEWRRLVASLAPVERGR